MRVNRHGRAPSQGGRIAPPVGAHCTDRRCNAQSSRPLDARMTTGMRASGSNAGTHTRSVRTCAGERSRGARSRE
eukprot:365622-Chlamydomonas_euryale.AAC.2